MVHLSRIALTLAFCFITINSASADNIFWLGPEVYKPRTSDYWKKQRFMEDQKNLRVQHPEKGKDLDWPSQNWLTQKDADALVDGYFQARIIDGWENDKQSDQILNVITVGPNFYRLSPYDQARVLKTMAADSFNVAELRDWYTKRKVGVYTAAEGLALY